MRALSCFAAARAEPPKRPPHFASAATTATSSGCHAWSRLGMESLVEDAVPIDCLTCVPEDLYNRLVGAAAEARRRGQHRLQSSRAKAGRRLVLSEQVLSEQPRSPASEPFGSLGSLDTALPAHARDGSGAESSQTQASSLSVKETSPGLKLDVAPAPEPPAGRRRLRPVTCMGASGGFPWCGRIGARSERRHCLAIAN